MFIKVLDVYLYMVLARSKIDNFQTKQFNFISIMANVSFNFTHVINERTNKVLTHGFLVLDLDKDEPKNASVVVTFDKFNKTSIGWVFNSIVEANSYACNNGIVAPIFSIENKRLYNRPTISGAILHSVGYKTVS